MNPQLVALTPHLCLLLAALVAWSFRASALEKHADP